MSENNHLSERIPDLDSQSNGVNTESNIDTYQNQVTHVDLKDEVLGESEDVKSTEDNMFVDCPDELITFDGKQKEEEAVAADENEEESQILHQQQSHFGELDNGVAGELEQLRVKLENAVAEKESVVNEYQELLSARDREIENLNEKVSQLMISNESLQASSEAQLEKDGDIDNVIDRMISSLASVVNQGQLLDDSRSGKIVYIEESTAVLIEKYNQMLSDIYQLGQSFSEVGSDTGELEYGNILVDARGGLLELKRKEDQLVDKLSHLESENQKLVEELDKERTVIGTLNTELGNIKVELEQEKVKSANTKEKLSMAVTKGKALVQQRDSLKTSLAGKSSELEKCLTELQEKSAALEAAELTKEELARSENMVASLNTSLQQNDSIFVQVEEILSHAELDQPEMLDLPERLRWLVDDRNKLQGAFLELRKLKESLSLVDLPEPVSSSDLESQMNWLIVSSHKARNDIYVLQEEISTIKEASVNCIDDLSILLLVDSQEKDYLRSELTDLRFEYGELVGKNHQISLEKDQIVKMLVDFSGLNMEDEGIDQFSSNTLMIIDLCFQKVKGQNGTLTRASHIDPELFERVQSLLYVRDQGLNLYEDILEEDILIRSDVNKLANELKVVSNEVIALKEEKSSLLKDLERSEEKTGMLRDKLSMAVKKGKGLVQDRDNLKGLINEKNSEIEQLKVDLEKQESVVSEYRDEINRLSSDLERDKDNLQSLINEKNSEIEQLKVDLQKQESMVSEYKDEINRLSSDSERDRNNQQGLINEKNSEIDQLKVDLQKQESVISEYKDEINRLSSDSERDRDSLQGLINEKNSEIEQLKVDLQKQDSVVSEYNDEINRLSSDLEIIPKLEADLLEIKRERNQFEQFLMESNNMLQRVMECIDGIALPVDPVFGEPMEKVKWLAGYVNECQEAKVHVEQQLQLVKEEASILEAKLAEAHETVNSHGQRLSSSEGSVSQLAEEKAELEQEKEKVVEELQKVKEKVAEVCSTSKSLEDALSQAEKDISVLSEEKEQAQVSRVAAETELERVRDEADRQTRELSEASITIKDLEVELSQVESKVNLLTEKNNADQAVKTELENELKKLQDEAANNASKLVGSSETIKSMEDALLKAQDDISTLEDANKIAKQEISSLSLKLNSYMDELAGKNGSLENKSLELIGFLNDLQVLMKDDTLFLRIKQCFEKKCETLKNVDLIVSKVRNHISLSAKDSVGHLEMEEDPPVRKSFSDGLEKFEVELDNREINGIDIDTIVSSFGKIVKGFQMRNEHIADKFDEFSDSIDAFISPLHGKLLETESNIMAIVEHVEGMKEKANSVTKLNEEKDNIIAALENDISLLLSACTDSTSELQKEVHQNLGQLGSTFEVEKLNHNADEQVEHYKNNAYADASRKLINASGEVQTLIRQFKFKSEQVDATVRDLQTKLNETTVAFELATEEKDLNMNKVLQLESDIQSLENACTELKDKVEHYHILEEKLKDKEAEISSMHSASLKKEESSILSTSQLRDIFDKIDRIEIPIVESEDSMESHTSDPVKKLFYIIDSVTRLHHQINSLSHDKKEMQSILETKALENKDLKEEVKQLNSHCEDSKMIKNELSELTSVLEKILDILGANNWVVDRQSKGFRELLPPLEKHIIAILSESENSKSKAHELGIKLIGSQKVIDDLTTKVKLLEDTIQDRISQPEIVQERSIYEAPSLPAGSEITEVEEGSLGKKALSPVPLAAHVRNMRKGSSDHLALDIGGESDQLINSADTDDDKGHAFKSLNTSGFVPKQGKLIADRIDGIW
ncbi:TGN-related, localized SYP41-interacting protein, putative [Medicago truncatula]|uniref:TGN-related, localized SYP41-interacting protein, putative n=2 Tax=Medicago truncatula TaxID=3880 RepID=G7J2J9_MEDTR|nr:TGN-related, localized SYP41-interacting protein, putative [Medicago truncatula]